MSSIRQLAHSDSSEMAKLHGSAFPTPEVWDTASIESLLNQPAISAYGVFSDGQLSAFIVVQFAASEAEILTLATHPPAQRQGLAGTLLGAVEAKLRPMGASKWLLDVAADNHKAIAFYEKHGYVVDGRRPQYYKRLKGGRIDAILMSRSMGGQVAP